MIYDSTVTTKFQATVPKAVRAYLGIGRGDRIIYDVDERHHLVTIRKASASDMDYLKSIESTLAEWNSSLDDEAYADL